MGLVVKSPGLGVGAGVSHFHNGTVSVRGAAKWRSETVSSGEVERHDPARRNKEDHRMMSAKLMRSLAAASIFAAGALASASALAVKVGPVEDPIRVVKIPKGQPIVIGVYEVLSGADTALGLDQWRGIQVAADDVGGKILDHPIKFIAEDEQCNAEGGQTAATKIAANQQTVVALGGSCSSATTPAAPILWKAGIPNIGTSPSAPTLTAPDRSKDYDGFVRTVYNDLWAGREVANWAMKVLNFKKFATIHDGSPYAEKLVRVFQKNIKEKGGEIVSDEAVAPTDTEMHPMLTKIAASKPDFARRALEIFEAQRVLKLIDPRRHAGLCLGCALLSDADGGSHDRDALVEHLDRPARSRNLGRNRLPDQGVVDVAHLPLPGLSAPDHRLAHEARYPSCGDFQSLRKDDAIAGGLEIAVNDPHLALGLGERRLER